MAKRPRVKGRGREIFLGKENETVKQQAVKTVEQQNAKTAKQQAVEVEKMTFYLPSELSDQLDEVRTKLKSRYRRERKVSKSEIVRIALEQALEDWSKDLKNFPEEELPSK